MPLFEVELDRLADSIGASTLTIWLHTAAPTEANPAVNRTSAGGGAYAAGVALAASGISNASGGDITNNAAIDFGTATANVGTVTHWSAVRGSAGVAYGTLPSTTINNGDSFQINAQTLDINGSTT